MFQIRKFRSDDAVSLARLHRGTIRSINKKDYTPREITVWSGRSSAKRFRNLGEINQRYVALESRKIVGFADYKDHELMGLYIHKNFLGKGIGKKLLMKIEREVYANGGRTLKCISTITARPFYEKNGFKVVKKAIHQIKDQKLPVFEMRKKLIRK
ncbi:GNAT family N-acetyltransferase [Candidatus Woesearchaeota archaeon]|nr:GNAT family N-acetyltransferase [Candidatus Woesearchaeota archaeon]